MTIFARPKFQLRSLPIRIRWEVTRRHPYYQIYWKLAREFHLGTPPEQPEDPFLRDAAVAVLHQIGISGHPPDPATEFHGLGEEGVRAAWLSGAVQPITLGGIAGLLMVALPKPSLQVLAALMYEAGTPDALNQDQNLKTALFRLNKTEAIGLDSYIDEPIVCVNPAASARDVRKALDALLRQWKKERGLSERRNRSEKFEDYLKIWDLREGWTGSAYDRSKERTLREVAQELKQPISTVSNHYRSAFEAIVGYPYSPEVWAAFFGVLKLSRLVQQPVGKVSNKRPQKNRSPVDVTESMLLPPPSENWSPGQVSFAKTYSDAHRFEILDDIRSLVEKGYMPDEIAAELELPNECISDIASFAKLVDSKPRRGASK